MNTNPEKCLDQRIRQVLDQLPDAPPPGSTFDAGRLWEQLRPELAAAPVSQPKRPVLVWWGGAAAACIVLILAGAWLYKAQNDQPTRVEVLRLPAPKVVNVPRPEVARTPELDESEAIPYRRRDTERAEPSDNHVATRPVPEGKNPETPFSRSVVSPALPASEPGEHVAHIAEPASLTPLVAERTLPPTPTPAKRRFRVVHENELLTEEETYRIRNTGGGRADRFVRLGSGHALSAASDEAPAMLQVPLQRKQTQ